MRFLELRLHGVSGTTPEALLGVKKIADPIAGDKYVRFVRPAPDEPAGHLEDSSGRVSGQLEGMSWGRLTSGSVLQATWLILLPFAILNLAYWARSWDGEGTCTALYRWFVRIIGLALTATIVFAVASGTLDQLAWQCAIQAGPDCRAVHSWLAPTATWSPGTILIVATLAPIIVTLLLSFLSHRASLRYEAFPPHAHTGMTQPGSGAEGGEQSAATGASAATLPATSAATSRAPAADAATTIKSDPDLFDDRMWRGDAMVSRLRTLHTATGIAVAALSLAMAVSGLETANRPFAQLAIGLAALTMAACVAFATPTMGLRWTDEDSMPAIGRRLLLAIAAAALVAAVIGAWPVSGQMPAQYDHLRGIIAAGHGLTVLQIAMVLGIAIVTLIARSSSKSSDSGASESGASDAAATKQPPSRSDGVFGAVHDLPRAAPAYGGYMGTLLAGFGAIAGFAYSAAVAFRVADWLSGDKQTDLCHCTTASVTTAYVPALATGAAAAAVYLVAVVIFGGILFMLSRRPRRWARYLKAIHEKYRGQPIPSRDDDNRIQRAVRARAYADMVSIGRLADLVMIAMVIAVAASVYALWGALNQTETLGVDTLKPPPSYLQTVVNHVGSAGSWIVLGFAGGLIALGGLAWRSEAARRIVGILWDVMSFWPRAGQPFAPPCYSERAVPQLVSRLRYLVTPDDRHGVAPADPSEPPKPQGVVLAGHSQGSILSAAALAQLSDLDPEQARHIALLTYGCPLERLYSPAFPRLFGPAMLQRLRVIGGPPRWINLWRPTDPIGGPLRDVLPPRPLPPRPSDKTPGLGDEELLDPTQLDMVEAKSAYAPIGGHLGYYSDPRYGQARSELVDQISVPEA